MFRSKQELASEMIQQAIIEGVPFQWVCGDSIYGTSPVFVQTVRELGKWYVVETSCDARVWTTKPKLRPVGHLRLFQPCSPRSAGHRQPAVPARSSSHAHDSAPVQSETGSGSQKIPAPASATQSLSRPSLNLPATEKPVKRWMLYSKITLA
ncbi:transposase [Gimesia maris]|nr:transposase [Gimesia maris]